MNSKSTRAKTTRKTTSIKKPAKKNLISLADEIEKEFFSLPSKLVALCRKEQLQLKQIQARLKDSLSVAMSKHQAGVKKLTILKNAKKPATRKQVITAQKTISTHTRLVNDIKRSISQEQKTLDAVAKKQAGFALLSKELPVLRRKMKTQSIKSVKKPAKQKKTRSGGKPDEISNRIQHDYHSAHSVLSTTPVDKTDSD